MATLTSRQKPVLKTATDASQKYKDVWWYREPMKVGWAETTLGSETSLR